jgi:hypothetical protein
MMSKKGQRVTELITSGVTLNKAETELVERYIWSTQTTVTPYQLNSVKGRVAVGLSPSLPVGGEPTPN